MKKAFVFVRNNVSTIITFLVDFLIISIVLSIGLCGLWSVIQFVNWGVNISAEPTQRVNTYTLDGEQYEITVSKCDIEMYEKNITPKEKSFLNGYIKIYDSDKLTKEILMNRKGTLVIERCIGVVTDAEKGDGRVLNAQNKDFDYISYRECDQKYTNGTVFVTFLVYNPTTKYTDDIMNRYDYIISREYERD